MLFESYLKVFCYTLEKINAKLTCLLHTLHAKNTYTSSILKKINKQLLNLRKGRGTEDNIL